VLELGQLPLNDLKILGEVGKQKRGALEREEVKVIRDKYWVK
jgi:hypothetical protein